MLKESMKNEKTNNRAIQCNIKAVRFKREHPNSEMSCSNAKSNKIPGCIVWEWSQSSWWPLGFETCALCPYLSVDLQLLFLRSQLRHTMVGRRVRSLAVGICWMSPGLSCCCPLWQVLKLLRLPWWSWSSLSLSFWWEWCPVCVWNLATQPWWLSHWYIFTVSTPQSEPLLCELETVEFTIAAPKKSKGSVIDVNL